MSDFKSKLHQSRFLLGLCPRPRWGSLQRSPRLAQFKEPTSKEREGEGRRWEGSGEGKGRGIEGKEGMVAHPIGDSGCSSEGGRRT